MTQTQFIMGMPITVEIVGETDPRVFTRVFDNFRSVDNQFSPFKPASELSRLNRERLTLRQLSPRMQEILSLCARTKIETDGYFDISFNGRLDTCGLVKGWAIKKAAELVHSLGYRNFYIAAGGDIQTAGKNSAGQNWRVGIRNPFHKAQIIQVLSLSGEGVATSGNYERGRHIYNPRTKRFADEVASITVVAKDILEADRFATAAFVMGKEGPQFIESVRGLESYCVGKNFRATPTSGWGKFIAL